MTAAPRIVRCRLEVTSDLPGDLGHIPFSPVIDFGALVAEAGAEGVFDPNSIEVVDLQTGQPWEAVSLGRSLTLCLSRSRSRSRIVALTLTLTLTLPR